jgi:PAS domain S-box-containing protein
VTSPLWPASGSRLDLAVEGRSDVGTSRQAAESSESASATQHRPAARWASGQRFTSSPMVLAEMVAGSEPTTEELLRAAFEQYPHGIGVAALDGRWLRINDAYCRMLGYEAADLLGASHLDVTHKDDAAREMRFAVDALADRRDSMEREKRYVRKDGSIMWARTRVEIIRDSHGAPLYFVSHVQDLSAHRATLDLLRDSERTLRSVIDNTPATISVKGPRSPLPARES